MDAAMSTAPAANSSAGMDHASDWDARTSDTAPVPITTPNQAGWW